jgi:hypothetical protein
VTPVTQVFDEPKARRDEIVEAFPAIPVHDAEPEPLDLDFTDVTAESVSPQQPAGASPLPPSAPPPATPQPAADDVFELDDIDTPAFLRRERKLFQ